MSAPISHRTTFTSRVSGTRPPAGSAFTQRNARANSAVSKTAGITVEKHSVHSALYSSGVNPPAPRYSQFSVRLLMISNSHHAGADSANNSPNARRDRVHIDDPVRRYTSASTKRIYPSHSGKKRYTVRWPCKVQFRGQQIATSKKPRRPCAGNPGNGCARSIF